MVKDALGIRAPTTRILETFHSRDIYFRPNREKPDLTAQDIADRYTFAQAFARKPESWWITAVDMTIDVRFYKVFTNKNARARAARSGS